MAPGPVVVVDDPRQGGCEFKPLGERGAALTVQDGFRPLFLEEHLLMAVGGGHAEIVQEGDTYLVADLGSTNGTELNGRRISREELTDGDRITVGGTDLVFGRSRG